MRRYRLALVPVTVLVLSATILLAQRAADSSSTLQSAVKDRSTALVADPTLGESYDPSLGTTAQEATISKFVTVTNFPEVQEVGGMVNVGNLPAVQEVSGTVSLSGASTSGRFQLVGFTSEVFPGSQGLLNFTKACQMDFPGSRMCSSREIVETTSVPDFFASGDAWVRPFLMPWSSGISQTAFDFSGTLLNPVNSSCDGWSTNSAARSGLIVAQGGQLVQRTCDTLHAAACCAPGD